MIVQLVTQPAVEHACFFVGDRSTVQSCPVRVAAINSADKANEIWILGFRVFLSTLWAGFELG